MPTLRGIARALVLVTSPLWIAVIIAFLSPFAIFGWSDIGYPVVGGVISAVTTVALFVYCFVWLAVDLS